MAQQRTSTQTMRLPGGCQLSYVEYGKRAGHPVLFRHGHPGARLGAGVLAQPATRRGIRLVGVDRPSPGGRSGAQQGGTSRLSTRAIARAAAHDSGTL
jgi:pimeloyl-ACP methyl ester carboxylesterase